MRQPNPPLFLLAICPRIAGFAMDTKVSGRFGSRRCEDPGSFVPKKRCLAHSILRPSRHEHRQSVVWYTSQEGWSTMQQHWSHEGFKENEA